MAIGTGVHLRFALAAGAVVCANGFCSRSLAQPATPDFASDYFIVKLVEDVEPAPLEDGRLSLRFTVNDDLPQDAGAVETLIADLIQGWAVAAIEPLIRVQLTDEIRALARERGADRLDRVDVPEGTDMQVAGALFSLISTHLEFACPAWYGHPATDPNDTYFASQWALRNIGQTLQLDCSGGGAFPCPCQGDAIPGTPDVDIDAPETWDLQLGDPDVVVAVIDSGIAHGHPDIHPTDSLVEGMNFVVPGDPEDTSDTHRHGTMITGIIAAASNNNEGIAGVTRGSRVMPLRVGIVVGPDLVFDVEWVFNALLHAAGQQQVRAINMSIGVAESEKWEAVLDGAIAIAYEQQKLMVAASGNSPNAVDPVWYPATDPRVMAVGSSDAKDRRSCFSNFGPELSVTAPGQDIVSTWNPDYTQGCADGTPAPHYYCRRDGTSFAAPYVAGLAALLFSADLTLTHDEVRQIIECTAIDLGDAGYDEEFGWGRINAFRAVSKANCPADTNEDTVVDVIDLLAVLDGWGVCASHCCTGDSDLDGEVGVTDLLDLLAAWGPCPASLAPPPPSLEAEVAAAGLTPAEWSTLMDCAMNSPEPDAANCVCWMEHYMDCHQQPVCYECSSGPCPGADPLGHH